MTGRITAVFPALILAAGTLWAADVSAGDNVVLQEVLVDQVAGETWLRFRFVAPALAEGEVDHAALAQQMVQLCDGLAIPYGAEYGLESDVIVISLGDRPTEFGIADPEATQFFEAYRPVDNACIWEAF